MFYQAELNFLLSTLQKLHLQALLLTPDAQSEHPLDFGLRAFLGRSEEYRLAFENFSYWCRPNTICKTADNYGCRYVTLLLPDTLQPTALMVGPYAAEPLDRGQLMEAAERLELPPREVSQLEKYYSSVPVMTDESVLFSLLNTFAERIWGSGTAYEIVDIHQDLASAFVPLPGTNGDSPAELMMNMQVMEQRYAFENELIRAVSQGLTHRAEQMVAAFSQTSFEQRMGDPVRNIKNYSIICNTILRKAAEQGGVHPVYLDSMSSDFAHRIESVRSLQKGQELLGEMIRSYCRLVKKHATRRYSATIQRTIAYIDADLSADLRLQTLAQVQNINASYLSTLFKKETGQTITDHINTKRMEHATHLLQTTRLQIQSIAQHCGISDPNYFSKLFKKHTGMTPGEYRSRPESGI